MADLFILLLCLTTVFEFFQPSIGVIKTPTPPLSNGLLGTTELPSTNLTLKYVAVGLGTQNYTCASSSSLPLQQGAVATLFDATWFAYRNESALNDLPPLAVYNAILPFPVLGHHFFDSAGTPTFDLSSEGKILYGIKTSDIRAPAAANRGPAGTGAVDWLQLTAKAGYESKGLSLAYRVVTAGGEPFNCTFPGTMAVKYAAEYWFYH